MENILSPVFDDPKKDLSNPDVLLNGVRNIIDESLKAAESSENKFPVEVFPEAVQLIISATNECLNFPIDFFGASILYAVSLAVGNTHRVQVNEVWHETAVIYLALVGRPNTNKSHPLSFALQPIINRDIKSHYEFEQKTKDYEKSEQKGNKPVWEKFLVSDFTPEALNEVHKFNKRGIGVYVDEFIGWFNNFDRYHKGSDQQFWLSNWSSKSIYVDRKSGNLFIPFPYIPVVGTIQTGVLSQLIKNNRTHDGSIYRILFAYPENLQKPYWSQKNMDPVIISNWSAIVDTLISLPLILDKASTPVPGILCFAPDAFSLMSQWQKQNTDICNQTDDEILQGIFGKFEIYIARFALILEMLNWACEPNNGNPPSQISIESVKGAIKLVKYFASSAIKVHSLISNKNPVNMLPTDKKNLYEALPDHFTTAQGLTIAKSYEIADRTFKTFLNDESYFEKTRHGEYSKKVVN